MSKTVMRNAVTFAAFLTGICSPAQWSFKIDTTFRTQIQRQAVNSLLVLGDGKIAASGVMRFPSEMADKRLVRLLPDGERDETFNNSGLGSGGIRPWQDDRFYVMGSYTPRRIWSNTGINDGTFAVGSGTVPYFIPSTTGDYHVFPDGRVLMSGSHTLNDPVRGFVGNYELIWFTNTGYLDTTRTHRNANGPIWEFKELPDGKFICTCSCTQYEGQPVSKAFRVNNDGSLDPSFQPSISWGTIYAYHGLPDGRIYVGGRYKRAAAPNDTLYLARFMPDGSLDPAFSLPQLSPGTLPGAAGAVGSVIYPWAGERLLLAGRFRSVNGADRNSICMLDSSGVLLNEFDNCGVGAFTLGNVTYASIAQVLFDTTSSALYICGAYIGYDDGTTNDTQQRFVSRLLVTELTTGVEGREQAMFRLYPNPAIGPATLEMEGIPRDTELVLRDVLGRELLRQRIRDQYTTLQLQHLPDGCYHLEVRNGVRRMAHQRLFIQH